MADITGPFDGVQWSEAQWYRFAHMWAQSGVVGSVATSVSSGGLGFTSSGLTVTLQSGRAWVRGGGREVGTTVSKTATSNANSNPRRDRIVMRRDLSTHTIEPVIIAGTPASSPVAPAITQNETGAWDLPLFSFQVPASGGTTLTNVVDERAWVTGAASDVAFFSTAARDAHFVSPPEGGTCLVNGVAQVYRAGSWRGVATSLYSTATFDSTLYVTTRTVASISIADPGFPYRIETNAVVDLAQVGAGVHARLLIKVNGTTLVPSGLAAFNDTAGTLTDQLVYLPTPAVSGTLTGASTVDLVISKESGAAGNGFQVSSTGIGTLFNQFSAKVVPV